MHTEKTARCDHVRLIAPGAQKVKQADALAARAERLKKGFVARIKFSGGKRMALRWKGLAMSFIALAGCQGRSEPVVVDQAMKETIAPQAQAIWDVSNRGMDDNGYPDASKLSAADWDKLGKSAQAMKDAATKLASDATLVAAPPGAKPQGGAATAEQIQSYIDADPKAFADHAQKLVGISDVLLASAKNRDATKLMDAAGGLDQVCEACHIQFWYPEQPVAGQ